MAQRLAQHGFEVTGWDQSPAAVRAFSGAGGTAAADARAVATAAPFVITTITEDSGLRGLFEGSRMLQGGGAGLLQGGSTGMLHGDIGGTLFIEMSTLQPATVRELAPAIEAHGARIIDSPVLGTIPSVRDGKLVALLGGAAEDVERARLVLDVLAHKVVHMGPLGSGHAMKLAANLGLAAYIQGLAESLALGEREGLSMDAMLGVLAAGPTANGWLNTRKGVLTGETVDVSLDIRTLRKDMMSVVATGARDGVTMSLSAGVLAALSAAVAGDWGDRDIGELVAFLREKIVQRYDS
jgi:3-hydroxyisobutyrate dehydrogenase-like beta-hydroxyacid dehydrogenase